MTLGARLQQARKARKLSLADVTRQTKIQGWVLETLEADRVPEQMSPIYVKGFLSTYARFLHLDPAPLLAELQWPVAESQISLSVTHEVVVPPPPDAGRFELESVELPSCAKTAAAKNKTKNTMTAFLKSISD